MLRSSSVHKTHSLFQDSEIKVEQEPQLEYIVVDSATPHATGTPPETPSSVTKRPTPLYGASSSPVGSPPFSALNDPTQTTPTSPSQIQRSGYVIIDKDKTQALRTLKSESDDRRNIQHRTLEKK